MNVKSIVITLLVLLVAFACQEEEVSNLSPSDDGIKQKMRRITSVNTRALHARKAGDINDWMASVNEALATENLQLEKIEFLGADQAGNTVFFEDRGNKQLSSDFVPNDPRNTTGTDVPYVIDGTELGTTSGMSETATYNAIVNSMNTWDAVTCSEGLNIPGLGATGFDIGYVQWLLGFGGIAGYFPGTITHSGILPSSFFDALDDDGGDYILGVTFTFVWLDDLDQDGRGDVAIKEIYINDGFNWQDAPDDVLGNGIYDFETVVLHEVGHGLSQAHFGKVFGTNNNGLLHFAPAALMNAGYSVARRVVTETDEAGHCSNWGNWPNN